MAPHANARFLAFQEASLDSLESKLNLAITTIEKFGRKDLARGIDLTTKPPEASKSSKLKYAWLEKRLSGLVEDLEKWFSIFDTSWWLLARLSSNDVDEAIAGSHATHRSRPSPSLTTVEQIRMITRGVNAEKGQTRPPLITADQYEHCEPLPPDTVSASLGKNRETGGKVILDDTAYGLSSNPGAVLEMVRNMALLLAISDPFSIGFLKCIALIRLSPTSFRYVLKLPSESMQPASLRSMLMSREPSLSQKVGYAKALSKAVMALHAARTVHKSIRPETIIVTEERDNGGLASNRLFLVGFEQIRPQYGHSHLVGDMEWYKNIYRHPTRQGLHVQEYYVMQHDIYSLGVCLFEMALWKSFVVCEKHESKNRTTANPELNIDSHLQLKNKSQAAISIKERLIDWARETLPAKVGDIFTEVVLSCLTCLDKGAANMFESGEDIYDDEGMVVGVTYIEKVLLRLEEIVV